MMKESGMPTDRKRQSATASAASADEAERSEDRRIEQSIGDYHRARQDHTMTADADQVKNAEAEVARNMLQSSDRLNRGRPRS